MTKRKYKLKTKGKDDEKKSKTIKLKGIAFWASVQGVNKRSNKFQLDLSVDKATAELLEDLGVELKEEKDQGKGKKRGQYVGTETDRGTFVRLKSEFKPMIVDAKKQELNPKTLIGNGSVVNVATHAYKWNFEGESGVSLGLDALQVIKLVEYASDPTAAFDEEEGFEAPVHTKAFDEDEEDEDEEEEAPKKSRTPKLSKDNPF